MTWPLKWGPTCSFDRLIELRASALEQMRSQGTKRFGFIDNEGGAIIHFFNDVEVARSYGVFAEPDREGIIWGVKPRPPRTSTMCPSLEAACALVERAFSEERQLAFVAAQERCRANGCDCIGQWERTTLMRTFRHAVEGIDWDAELRAVGFEAGDEWAFRVRFPALTATLETTSKRTGHTQTVVLQLPWESAKDR